jgi:hypothetical protein
VGALGLFALIAGAEPKTPAVRVSVVAILASETDTVIDPRLKCIACELQKMNPKLTGFRYGTMTRRSVPVDEETSFDLVEGQKVKVTVEKGMDKDARVQLKVTPPLIGEIAYDSACGKFLPIITRYRTEKKNEVLILAVCVQPCRGGK